MYLTHTVVETKIFVHFSHPRRLEGFAKKAIVDIINVVLGRTFKGRCQTRTIILFLLDPPNSTSDHSKLLGMLPLNLWCKFYLKLESPLFSYSILQELGMYPAGAAPS